MLATSFTDATSMAGDAVTLVTALIALGVTIIGWKIGRRLLAGFIK